MEYDLEYDLEYDYYASRSDFTTDEWLLDKRKEHKHKILQLAVKAFLVAQKYGLNHEKTKDAWHESYCVVSMLEYYSYNIEFNSDPLVFYRDLSQFCMYDRFHSESEKSKIAYMMLQKGIEYCILTKLPPLKKSPHEIIVNFIKYR